MIALVYLLDEPRPLTEEELRQVVSEELDVEISADDENAECVVVEVEVPAEAGVPEGAVTCFMVRLGEAVFTVNNFAIPYLDNDEEAAENTGDECLLRILKEHSAWISMDYMGDVEDEEEWADAYLIIGRVMAGLAGPDCVALYCPSIDSAVEYDDDVLDILRSDWPLALFEESSYSPESLYDGDDPRINAAVEEARERWPEFVAAFSKREHGGPPFAAKVRFEDEELVEYLWVIVTAIEGDQVSGIVDSNPHDLSSVEAGDPAHFLASEIYDWVYPNGNEPAGAFTMKAIEEELGE